MNASRRKLGLILVLGSALLGLVWLVTRGPGHPVAVFRVVDAAGKPIAGAVILPEGMRTKPGPYRSGWYSWMSERNGVPNPPVTTDRNGSARVPYPKYVFERIETGQLCLAVEHPEYVPDRPERMVAAAPPRGAPWLEWLQWLSYIAKAVFHRGSVEVTDPIVLQKGAIVKLRLRLPNGEVPRSGRSSSQVSGNFLPGTNFWTQLEPGLIESHQMSTNAQTLRAVHVTEEGYIFYSQAISIAALSGITNEIEASLYPGVAVRGRIDDAVSRPVHNGKVIANVWPVGFSPQSNPPYWHSWSEIRADGAFELPSLPAGDLELVALCDGFVSTNGPGQTGMHYPQKHVLGTNDLSVVIGMEPTVRLEVTVTDPQGHPVKDATVTTWPNVRYGEWAATILGGDCHITADWIFKGPPAPLWTTIPSGFKDVTGSNGVAVLSNLPAEVTALAVEHDKYALAPTTNSAGGQNRQVGVRLVVGKTNYLTVPVVPANQYKIKHY